MAIFALILGLFFVPYALFNVGGTTSSTGMGDIVTKPAPVRSPATLTLRKAQPVPIIAGAGFKSRELVRFKGVPVSPVRAAANGTFVVRLRAADACGLSITAIGSKGSRAALNYSQLLCIEP